MNATIAKFRILLLVLPLLSATATDAQHRHKRSHRSTRESPPIAEPEPATHTSGDYPVALRLIDGTVMPVDAASETPQGIWYTLRGVSYLIGRERIKTIERSSGGPSTVEPPRVAATTSTSAPRPVWIYLVDGARLEVDHADESSAGVLYRRGSLAAFIERGRIDHLEREEAKSHGSTTAENKERRWSSGTSKIDALIRQVPVDVVLMVDASSSVAANLEDFRRAAAGFADSLGPDDRVSLIQFDDRVLLLQDWTSSRVQFRRSLQRLAPGMFTRFNDAIVLAAGQQFQRGSARRAIIVLTNGIDSGRGTTFDQALGRALEGQATVYVVSNSAIERARKQSELDVLADASASALRFNQLRIDDLRLGLEALDASEKNLELLTRSTGGRLYRPTTFDDLGSTYAEVANELRHQYALYYSPINKKRDGQFRKVRVENQAGNQVSARVGYYAPR